MLHATENYKQKDRVL